VEISSGKKPENYIEKLIKTYQDGDLASIEKNYSDYSFELIENLLYYRNRIMANTIDSVIKNTTLFATCGAAHLGGTSGIIELLKQKGYTLTPVKTKNRSYLKAEESIVNFDYWKSFSSPTMGINCNFPGASGNYSSKSLLYSDMRMYMDIATGNTYIIFPISATINTSDKSKIFDKYTDAVSLKYFGSTLKETKECKHNGLIGREIVLKNYNNLNKIRMFIENNIFYILSVTYHENSTSLADVDHFFNSIQLFPPISSDAFLYKNDKWAFEINLPAKPNEKPTVTREDGIKTESLSLKSSDNINGIHFILEVAEAGAGRYYENDTIVLKKVLRTLTSSPRLVSHTDTTFMIQGNKCVQVKAMFDDSSFAINNSILRGYKFYNILAVMSAASERLHKHDAFLESFNFTPLPEKEFKYYPVPYDSALLIKLPAPLSFNKSDTIGVTDLKLDELSYQAYDSRTAYTYFVQKYQEGDYYYTTSDSVYWSLREKDVLGYFDTLLFSSEFKIGKIKAKSFLTKNKDATSVKNTVVLNFGKYRYHIFGYFPVNDPFISNQSFLKDIIYKKEFVDSTVSDTSAFNKLIKDILSQDTVYSDKARSNIYPFIANDNMFNNLTTVLDTLNYKKDSLDYFDLKSRLIWKLESLNKTKTNNYIYTKLYNKKDSAYWDSYASILAKNRTKENYQKLKEFYLKNITQLGNYGASLYTLNDSIELCKELFPEILEAFKKCPDDIYALTSITESLLDSGLLTYKDIEAYEFEMIKKSEIDIKSITDKKDIFNTYFNNQYLGIFTHAENKKNILKHYVDLSKSKNIWCSYYGILELMKSEQEFDEKKIKEIASIPYLRNMLYEDLSKINRSLFFPEKYKTQKSLAEGDITRYIMDVEEMTPKKVTFLREVNTKYKNQESIFYLYKVETLDYENKKSEHLYTSGPYINTDLINTGEKTGYVGDFIKGIEEIQLLEYLFTE
jgi:hypothetical protein